MVVIHSTSIVKQQQVAVGGELHIGLVLDEIDTVTAHRNVGRRAELASHPAAAAGKAGSLVAFVDFEYGDALSGLAQVVSHAEADNAAPDDSDCHT